MSGNSNTKYIIDGHFPNGTYKIIEQYNGISVFIWKGYYDGRSVVKMYPMKCIGYYDGVKRNKMVLSITELTHKK